MIGGKVEHEATKKPRRAAVVHNESTDPNAIRTLVLSGLPAGLTKAVLWKKVRKVDDRVDLVFPVEGVAGTGEHYLNEALG